MRCAVGRCVDRQPALPSLELVALRLSLVLQLFAGNVTPVPGSATLTQTDTDGHTAILDEAILVQESDSVMGAAFVSASSLRTCSHFATERSSTEWHTVSRASGSAPLASRRTSSSGATATRRALTDAGSATTRNRRRAGDLR